MTLLYYYKPHYKVRSAVWYVVAERAKKKEFRIKYETKNKIAKAYDWKSFIEDIERDRNREKRMKMRRRVRILVAKMLLDGDL